MHRDPLGIGSPVMGATPMVVAHYGMCPSGTCEGVPKADAFKREPWLLLFANPRGSGRPSLDGASLDDPCCS